MKRRLVFHVFLLILLAMVAGCGDAKSPPENGTNPKILSSERLGYYMSGWKLEYDGGVIRADEPLGTGSEMVNAYIKRSGEEERLLTPYMGTSAGAYLSGDWLYFSYADTDSGVYETCRINVKTLDEPEFLGGWLRFATNDYIYYSKDDDFTKIYRRDANYENEALTLTFDGYWPSLYPAGDRLVHISDNSENMITVYDQQGNRLFETEAKTFKLWEYRVYGGEFFWFEHAYTPDEPIRIHKIDIYTGQVTSLSEAFIEIEGFPCGIADIDESGIYVKINAPFPVDLDESDEPFLNTKLYRIPHTGGSAEFVREWFES